jgi:hypothetical protein
LIYIDTYHNCDIFAFVSWLFEKKARISQTEAEEIATEIETSAEQEREWFPLADNEHTKRSQPKGKGLNVAKRSAL